MFCISNFFADPTRNLNYKGKQNSEKLQSVKIRLNLKANDINLNIRSNLLYFNFANSRQRTMKTKNVLNLVSP